MFGSYNKISVSTHLPVSEKKLGTSFIILLFSNHGNSMSDKRRQD